jgi:hypothetical protein
MCPSCEKNEAAENCMGLCAECYAEFAAEYNEHLDAQEREALRLKVTGEVAA